MDNDDTLKIDSKTTLTFREYDGRMTFAQKTFLVLATVVAIPTTVVIAVIATQAVQF